MSECGWKVVYRFSVDVEVQNPVPAYEDLGVTLHYEGDRLVRVEHELCCDENLRAEQVIHASRERLKLFWELLRYRRGLPLSPCLVLDAGKSNRTLGVTAESTRCTSVALGISLCSPILMPDPGFIPRFEPRLLVWLRLANDASDSHDPADAIRNYRMIWEDLHGGEANQPIASQDLRLTRNFVSHGGCPWEETLGFIQRQDNLGPGVARFDPTDNTQQQFLCRQRKSARALIEAELEKHLR